MFQPFIPTSRGVQADFCTLSSSSKALGRILHFSSFFYHRQPIYKLQVLFPCGLYENFDGERLCLHDRLLRDSAFRVAYLLQPTLANPSSTFFRTVSLYISSVYFVEGDGPHDIITQMMTKGDRDEEAVKEANICDLQCSIYTSRFSLFSLFSLLVV